MMLSTSTGEQARLLSMPLTSDFASCLKFGQTSGLLFSRHSHSSGMRKVPEAVSKEYLP